jgi:hypothetical protein
VTTEAADAGSYDMVLEVQDQESYCWAEPCQANDQMKSKVCPSTRASFVAIFLERLGNFYAANCWLFSLFLREYLFVECDFCHGNFS